MNGYKRLLRDPSTGKYRAGSSFSDLIALYEFDSSLRELFSHSLSYVERKMRSVVSYTFWGGIPGACLRQQLANETGFAVAFQGFCIVKKRFSTVHRLRDVYNDEVVNDCVKTCTFWHNRPIASHPNPHTKPQRRQSAPSPALGAPSTPNTSLLNPPKLIAATA